MLPVYLRLLVFKYRRHSSPEYSFSWESVRVQSSPRCSFSLPVHNSKCSWVSVSTGSQCLHVMSSLQADDLFALTLTVILLLTLNQLLVSHRFSFLK